MHFRSNKTQNIQVDQTQEFKKKIKHIDTTYTNRLVSSIKINVPDLDNGRLDHFSIDTHSLKEPLTCIHYQYNNSFRIRPIKIPEYQEYQYKIEPFNDYIPFVGKDTKRPYGEMYYRNKTLTPINELPKIQIDLDNKINMKKW